MRNGKIKFNYKIKRGFIDMKALTREQLILCIEANYKESQIIFEDSPKMKDIFKNFGHDWHIGCMGWEETKRNKIWDKYDSYK